MERELDSAWGARGHVTQSADSNIGPGEGHTDTVPGTQDDTAQDSQYDSQGVNPDNSPGGRGFEIEQPDVSSHPQNVGLRRSSRAGKGRTSRFRDCITGSELDEIGEE